LKKIVHKKKLLKLLGKNQLNFIQIGQEEILINFRNFLMLMMCCRILIKEICKIKEEKMLLKKDMQVEVDIKTYLIYYQEEVEGKKQEESKK